MLWMLGKSRRGPLPALTSEQAALRDELRRHVQQLGGEIGERNVRHLRQLRAAADYVAEVFTNAGYRVQRQGYTVQDERCENLEVEIRGREQAEEIVVVGAHYDSPGGSPGANDNASGVASLLSPGGTVHDAPVGDSTAKSTRWAMEPNGSGCKRGKSSGCKALSYATSFMSASIWEPRP